MSVRSDWSAPTKLKGSDPEWPRYRLRALAYGIGVLLKGDGYVSITRKTDYYSGSLRVYRAYKLGLKNKSIGFIREFNRACSIFLKRKTVRIANRNHDGHHEIQYCCKAFVLWWRGRGFSSLCRIIEAFPVEYLRGRFDSDCNVHGRAVDLCGAESHRELMEFERELCARLGMRTGIIHNYGKPGMINYIGQKRIVSKQQRIRFTVNARDFLNRIGKLNVEWRDHALRHAYKGRQWTQWPAVVRERAEALQRERNWKCKRIVDEIRKEFGESLPYTTVYGWLNVSIQKGIGRSELNTETRG